MYSMQIQNNNTSFKAKFIDSEGLRQVVNYALEHNKEEKLNSARKNIESSYMHIRVKMDIGETDKGFPKVIFTRYKPKSFVLLPKNYGDYIESKPIEYVYNAKKKSALEFAYDLLIKMGSSVPKNKVFQKVVIKGSLK